MPRTTGARNADYAHKRALLAGALVPALLAAHPQRLSLRELADAAGVSVSTLRHYFGGRDGAVSAALEQVHQAGTPYMEAAAQPGPQAAEEVLAAYLAEVCAAWLEHGVGRMFGAALAEGLDHPGLGPVMVEELLEPTLQTGERLLGGLVARGALPPLDLRAAALSLLAPVLLALLHQGNLGGRACRPLDLPGFIEQHRRAWWRGWGAGN